MRWNGMAGTMLLGVALATGCADESGELPLGPDGPSHATVGSTLIECPVSETRSVTGTLGIDGGTLELDGHSITLPVGAVLLPTELTLTVPAGNYVEVDIHAAGQETYQFQEPVTISVSYERCTRSNIDNALLTVWHIDESTKALLEDMGGSDDKVSRRVTFTSGHLSGFAIAN